MGFGTQAIGQRGSSWIGHGSNVSQNSRHAHEFKAVTNTAFQ